MTSQPESNAALDAALAYAARGWPVFPCRPGRKIPATAHRHLDATTDPDQIQAWFGRHPDRNLAIATGAPGPDVLDIGHHGQAGNGFAEADQLYRALLLRGAGVVVRTPAGGQPGADLAPLASRAGLGDREIRATLTSALRTTQHRPIHPQHSPRGRTDMTQHSQHHATTPDTSSSLTPDPCAAREHISRLRQDGGTYRAIAQAAGLSTVTVHDIATQRWQPTPAAVTALLRVRPRTFQQLRIDAGGTRLRLRALHVMGHGSARLARATGASDKTIRAIVTGDAKTVSLRLRDTVVTVYDQWWDKRAPERTRAERAAARDARRRAIAGNWCAPAALDDDELDTPSYKPRYGWRPATGTGFAADICPPRRTQARRGA